MSEFFWPLKLQFRQVVLRCSPGQRDRRDRRYHGVAPKGPKKCSRSPFVTRASLHRALGPWQSQLLAMWPLAEPGFWSTILEYFFIGPVP